MSEANLYNSRIAIYRNAFLIYNPFAGQLIRNSALIERTVESLHRGGHSVQAIPTHGPRTAAAIARDCVLKGADLVLAAGGDGTINEVMNGLVGTNTPMGIMPAGTANVLAVELGTGKRMVKVAERLHEFVPHRISVGEIEHNGESRHFLLMAGLGMDALIVYQLNASLKKALGKVAYWLAGFSQFGRRLGEFDVTIDGVKTRCSFALASRVRNYGGDLWIAKGANLFDDSFEVVLFQGAHSFHYVKYLAGVIIGRVKGLRGVTVVRACEVEACCATDPRVYAQVDGELVGRLPVKLRIVPKSLTLLTPPGLRDG